MWPKKSFELICLKKTLKTLVIFSDFIQLSESLSDPQKYETFLESRPAAMENEAIKMVVGLCRDSGSKISVSFKVIISLMI
jgi:hypothetical protein